MNRNVPEWEALCHSEYPGLIAAIDVEPIVTITCHDDLECYDDLIGVEYSVLLSSGKGFSMDHILLGIVRLMTRM